jgi:energy-converting hydrogenase Eha subunit E
MRRKRNAAGDRRRRRIITVLWTAVLAIGTIILIYKEMTALLYILATLGVTALLLVVAMADLAHAERLTNDPRASGDSAAIGSGITSTMGNNQS